MQIQYRAPVIGQSVSRHLPRLARNIFPLLAWLVIATLSMLGGYLLGRRNAPTIKSERLDVYVLNVKQGEAAWLRTPNGHTIVIGAGPPGSGRRVLEDLQHAGVRKIDILALPYPYAEAVGGAEEILAGMPVDQVIEPGGAVVNQWQQHYRSFCATHKIPDNAVAAGEQFLVDTVRITVLAPGVPALTAMPTGANNSLVLKIRWRETAFVWAGGVERAGEDALLSREADLSAAWLRVARFGTRNASSAEFLSAVSPEIAVVSVGTNSEGYPHAETLKRLNATGARLYQTAASSSHLHFVSDGTHVVFAPTP